MSDSKADESKRKVLKNSGISISEDLTKFNVQLMNRLRNDPRVENTWSSNGNVFAKVKGNPRELPVKLFESLSEVLTRYKINSEMNSDDN